MRSIDRRLSALEELLTADTSPPRQFLRLDDPGDGPSDYTIDGLVVDEATWLAEVETARPHDRVIIVEYGNVPWMEMDPVDEAELLN